MFFSGRVYKRVFSIHRQAAGKVAQGTEENDNSQTQIIKPPCTAGRLFFMLKRNSNFPAFRKLLIFKKVRDTAYLFKPQNLVWGHTQMFAYPRVAFTHFRKFRDDIAH